MPGSDKLRPFKVGMETIEDIHAFIDAMPEAELERLWMNGQPAPESVMGSVAVSRSNVGDVVTGILERGANAGMVVKVFPFGIPNVERYQVDFGTFGAEGL